MSTTPQFLGRYELLESLGEGGMGAVWLARLTGTGGFEKLCIVKTVLPAIAKDAQFVSRFSHEGRVLTQLQHSNIAQVFDMGEAEGTLYIALEYIPGLDLSKLMRATGLSGKKLPIEVSTYIIQQAAEGLGFAHRKTLTDGSPLNIVHRDVSPQNIMVSWDGEVKVIDFGISRSEARSQSTAQATVMGKLGYMAPEQARGETLDHRADQYALGVVLWELLASQPLVPRGTVTEMVVAMAHPKVRPLSPLLPDVPKDLEAVVLKSLSANPADRYENTDDFARALMDALARRSGIPTRRQIGEFVKQWGEEQFVEQKALLTRISTIRTPHPGSITGTEKTSLSGSVPAASRNAEPTPNTAELAKSVKRSSAPLIIGAFIGVAILAVGVFAVINSKSDPKPLTPPVAAAPPAEPSPAPPKPALPVEEAKPQILVHADQVAETYAQGDTFFVRAGSNLGLKAAQTLPIVGPELPGGGRALVGQAVVIQLFPDKAEIGFNAVALAMKGERFVMLKDHADAAAQQPVAVVPVPPIPTAVVPDAGAPSPVALVKVEPPKPPAPLKMAAMLKLQRTPIWAITVTNTSGFGWTNCNVFIPGKKKWLLKSLSAGFAREMPLQYFSDDASAPNLTDTVELRCNQGSIRLPAAG